MTREQFQEKVEKAQKVFENVQNSLQFTNIPVYVLVKYIYEETGINMESVTTGKE